MTSLRQVVVAIALVAVLTVAGVVGQIGSEKRSMRGRSESLGATSGATYGSGSGSSGSVGSATSSGGSSHGAGNGAGADLAAVRISDVSILLPYDDTAAPYRLFATGGCFEWTSQNEDMVEVTPLYEVEGKPSCSRSAVVKAVAPLGADRIQAWVYAEEPTKRKKLRCEVFVDQISVIEILTTTREMFREETEVIEVQAFDSVGNIFNSLDGLHFEWTLDPVATSEEILRVITFSEHNVETTHLLRALEERGITSGAILVEAMVRGKVDVSVRLLEEQYGKVAASTARITVRDPLELMPLYPVYMLPASELGYQLFMREAAGDRMISMPNSQYKWFSENETCAGIDDATGLVWGEEIGKTRIYVEDQTMPENVVYGSVHVVPPAYIELSIYDLSAPPPVASNWILVRGREYALKVELYDMANHRIYIAHNVNFRVDYDGDYFALEGQPEANWAAFNASTLQVGLTPVSATLLEIHNDGTGRTYAPTHAITARQEAMITDPVTIEPKPLVRLSWDPSVHTRFACTPGGGSGEYAWSSSDAGVASVDDRGELTVWGLGETTVTLCDARNPTNCDSTRVVVDVAADIDFLNVAVEAEVGSALSLPLALYDRNGNTFTGCASLPIRFTVSDGSLFGIDQDVPSAVAACRDLHITALREGYTVVHARYGDLKAKVTVFAYAPLHLVSPSPECALVTLGSSWDFVFEGGPPAWVFDTTQAYADFVPASPGVVRVRNVDRYSHGAAGSAGSASSVGGAADDGSDGLPAASSSSYASSSTSTRRVYRVTCTDYGEQVLTLKMGNKASDGLPFPATATASACFSCAVPAAARLSPAFGSERDPSLCAKSAMYASQRDGSEAAVVARYQLQNGREVPLGVAFFDGSDRMFHNYTSLDLAWSTSDKALASFAPGAKGAPASQMVMDRHAKGLNLAAKEGSVFVDLDVSKFRSSVLSRARTKLAGPSADASLAAASSGLRRRIQLELMDNVAIFPTSALLFDHDDVSLDLVASGGSGTVRFESNGTQIVDMGASDGASIVTIRPLNPGTVRISAVDPCLDASMPATAHVRVADIGAIQVRMRERCEVGKTIPVDVVAVDASGAAFDASQLRYMSIKDHVDNSAVGLSAVEGSPGQYTISCRAVGSSRVTFLAQTKSGRTVSSEARQIYVYPRMRFNVGPGARVMHLLCGSSRVVSVSGGPHTHATTTFATADRSVATVNNNGLIQGVRVGRTTMTVMSVGYDPYTDGDVVFGEDTIEVIVSSLSGISIAATTNKVQVGSEITVRLQGEAGETPIDFGSADLNIHWDVTNPEVASLRSVNANSHDLNDFSVRVVAEGIGRTTVKVHVEALSSCTGPASFDATLTLLVVDPLTLLHPTACDATLLLPPLSGSCIRTNKDNRQQIRYDIVDASGAVLCGSSGGSGGVGGNGNGNGGVGGNGNGNGGSIISVDYLGCVTSTERSGTAYVLVTDTLEDESTVVTVRVKPFDHLSLYPSDYGDELPVGSVMTLSAALRDDVGSPFSDLRGVAFDAVTSHDNIVRVTQASNGTFSVKGLSPGSAVVRVFISALPAIDDYVRITVGQAIDPSQPVVHVGGSVSFAPVAKGDGKDASAGRATWTSADGAVVSVDPLTGQAQARGVGKTTIYCNRDGESTYTQATVVRIGAVSVGGDDLGHLTNVGEAPSYLVPLSFVDSLGSPMDGSDRVSHNIQHSCSLIQRGWATVSAVEGEAPACKIVPLPPAATALLHGSVTSLTLVVHAGDRDSTYRVSANKSLAFEPAFSIRNAPEDGVLAFDANHKTAVVEVTGTREHLVATSADNRVVLIERETDDAAAAATTLYEVSVAAGSGSFDDAQIEFYNYVSSQRERLDVRYVAPAGTVPVVHHVPKTPTTVPTTPAPATPVVPPAAVYGGETQTVWAVYHRLLLIVLVVLLLVLVLIRGGCLGARDVSQYDHVSTAPLFDDSVASLSHSRASPFREPSALRSRHDGGTSGADSSFFSSGGANSSFGGGRSSFGTNTSGVASGVGSRGRYSPGFGLSPLSGGGGGGASSGLNDSRLSRSSWGPSARR